MEKKQLARLIVVQLETLTKDSFDGNIDGMLTLFNEVLRDASKLAEAVLEEESEENQEDRAA